MEQIICFTKGISRGNPGPAAIGVVLVSIEGDILTDQTELIGNAADEYVEYFAVVRGLQMIQDYLKEKSKHTEVLVHISNKDVQKQLDNKEAVLNPGLVSLFMTIHNLTVENFATVSVSHVTADKNKVSDTVLNDLLDDK